MPTAGKTATISGYATSACSLGKGSTVKIRPMKSPPEATTSGSRQADLVVDLGHARHRPRGSLDGFAFGPGVDLSRQGDFAPRDADRDSCRFIGGISFQCGVNPGLDVAGSDSRPDVNVVDHRFDAGELASVGLGFGALIMPFDLAAEGHVAALNLHGDALVRNQHIPPQHPNQPFRTSASP